MDKRKYGKPKNSGRSFRTTEINKRCTAIMIGALATLEDKFGYLWGHAKAQDQELTPDEEQFLIIWQEARTEILDKGNWELDMLKKNLGEI